jgi:hypothetical protein
LQIKKLRRLVRIAPTALGLALLAFGACTPQPVEPTVAWRAFRGEFTSTSGGVETRGRYYRHRDGSVRRDVLRADGSPEFITIENVAASRFYSFSGGSWTSQPLRIAARRMLPPTAADFPNASPQTARVAGYRVVSAYTVLGTLMLRAPALDYFPLVEDHPHPALRVAFVSIVEEPSAGDLFVPPAGTAAAELPWTHTLN